MVLCEFKALECLNLSIWLAMLGAKWYNFLPLIEKLGYFNQLSSKLDNNDQNKKGREYVGEKLELKWN
jgi:hypothetical protein